MLSNGAVATMTPKGERTKAVILETAINLFKERGFEQTTMRAIAEQAGVALGNAYYYFRSKEDLVHAFYWRAHYEHVAASRPILARERDFRLRLLGVMRAKLQTLEPYHRFSAVMFRTAADPKSPLSPFGPESHAAREANTELFKEVVTGSNLRLPPDMAEELPGLLWLYSMGIVLFWIHDASGGRVRTLRLVEHTVNLIAIAAGLAANPLLAPVRKTMLALLADLRRY